MLFLGYLPPVNLMRTIGERPREEPGYPAELLRCRRCTLIQLGLLVDPNILFPPTYPYTSGTTRILRENFAELSRECRSLLDLSADDLVIDIGSNDGTLLSNFADGQRVFGHRADQRGQACHQARHPDHHRLLHGRRGEAGDRRAGPPGSSRPPTSSPTWKTSTP